MLAALLVRLTMVVLTLAVVFWIGWSLPRSQDTEPLHAAETQPSNVRLVDPEPSMTPQAAPILPPERRQEKSSARHATGSLDLNSATEEDLQRLPGIGHVLAERIVAYRATQGPFRDIEQLRRVKGIGKKKFEEVRSLVAVGRPGVSKPARKAA